MADKAGKREFWTKHTSVLCSEYFNDEDFENITPRNKRRDLKPDLLSNEKEHHISLDKCVISDFCYFIFF